MNFQFGTMTSDWPNDPVHVAWLAQHRDDLLDFYQPNVCDPDGGYNWLDAAGAPLRRLGKPLWLNARMLHVFSLATMLGRVEAADVAAHGVRYLLDGPLHDRQHGGWFSLAADGEAAAPSKELYGLAHVLLAGTSALAAGLPGADSLIDEALMLVDRHFWVDELGVCLEAFNSTFTEVDAYRGQNANMHMTEALIAAYEVTGDQGLLQRAVRIASFIAKRALDGEGSWRLAEHYDVDWKPMPDYNIDQPRHPFRPYGSLVGHWLEWAKLCLQLRGLGVEEEWLLPVAQVLFRRAVEEGWQDSGGFVYTVDWQGRPVVSEKYFWAPAEAIGASCYLWKATGDSCYNDWYRKLWSYSNEYFADHELGSWHHELSVDNSPISVTWEGKPDAYHIYQATLYALLPTGKGLAAWARDRS